MKKKLIILLLTICTPCFSHSDCTAHTWHDVVSQNGQWQISLRFLAERGQFVDRTCQPQHDRLIDPNTPYHYGLIINKDSTFDMAYTVTAIRQDALQFYSPTCVFIVTVRGPAIPDVKINAYNGAQCEYTDNGYVNFQVG